RARRYYPGWTVRAVRVAQAHDGTQTFVIAGLARERHSDSRLCALVSIEHGRGAMLCHHEVHPTVSVEIGGRGASLLSIDFDAGLHRSQGLETPVAVSQKEQAPSGVLPWYLHAGGKEVLAEKQVIHGVPVEVRHEGRECGGDLCDVGKRDRFERCSSGFC